MNKLLNVYKPVNLTPFQVIQQLREQYPEYKDKKIGYAGRLDPLAHGVLVLMIGEATKEREKHQALTKEYEFEALFGIETDSYDVLGLLRNLQTGKMPEDFEKQISEFIKKKIGNQMQTYPPFSSKAVEGKPLFWWAKQNRISEITIPTREITIEHFELLSIGSMTGEQLRGKVKNLLQTVQGDFRQEDIWLRWQNFFVTNITNTFITARFRITCSSGTYVRSLVHDLGKELTLGAIATEILRTKVGQYRLEDALKITG